MHSKLNYSTANNSSSRSNYKLRIEVIIYYSMIKTTLLRYLFFSSYRQSFCESIRLSFIRFFVPNHELNSSIFFWISSVYSFNSQSQRGRKDFYWNSRQNLYSSTSSRAISLVHIELVNI